VGLWILKVEVGFGFVCLLALFVCWLCLFGNSAPTKFFNQQLEFCGLVDF